MTGSWMTRYLAEFLGTAVFIVFGNGSVANSFLKKPRLMAKMVKQTEAGFLLRSDLALV